LTSSPLALPEIDAIADADRVRRIAAPVLG
jgi:hypothetical protein